MYLLTGAFGCWTGSPSGRTVMCGISPLYPMSFWVGDDGCSLLDSDTPLSSTFTPFLGSLLIPPNAEPSIRDEKTLSTVGLYSYGISENLMMSILSEYRENFPMELDRYFVTTIQPENMSYAITPQLFSAEDNLSDNSHVFENGLLEKSIDSRFAKLQDYI